VNHLPRNNIRWLFFSLMLLGTLFPVSCYIYGSSSRALQSADTIREGWAVLMEMNDYPSGADLATGYSDTRKWNSTLHALGWQTNHILIHQGSINQQTGEAALQFLSMNADANDVVLFFIFAHGNYLLEEVHWQSWFPTQWKNLVSQEKLLVIAACTSEIMLQPLYDDPVPHIHLASAEAYEYAWAGLPEEGLPVIGEIFSHYLANALVNSTADVNADGDVSVEEAFLFASPLSQNYISSVVFPAFPDYAEMCNHVPPHPVMDDGYTGNFSLQVELGTPPAVPTGFRIEHALVVLAIVLVASILIGGLLLIRQRKMVK
jgi:hypothetical protein